MQPAALLGIGQQLVSYRQHIASIHPISSHVNFRAREPNTTNRQRNAADTQRTRAHQWSTKASWVALSLSPCHIHL